MVSECWTRLNPPLPNIQRVLSLSFRATAL